MNQVWVTATIRATTGGVVLAGAAFFGSLSTGSSLRTAGIAAGVAFFGYLVTRGVAEGIIDNLPSSRTAAVQPIPSDRAPPPVPPVSPAPVPAAPAPLIGEPPRG